MAPRGVDLGVDRKASVEGSAEKRGRYISLSGHLTVGGSADRSRTTTPSGLSRQRRATSRTAMSPNLERAASPARCKGGAAYPCPTVRRRFLEGDVPDVLRLRRPHCPACCRP